MAAAAAATWAGYFVFQVVCAVVTGVMSPATSPSAARFAFAYVTKFASQPLNSASPRGM
jgi:hypothetical protein